MSQIVGSDPSSVETTTRGDTPRIPHVAALDGLRGLAVAAVVLFHGNHLTGGYLGVDLFFVLSGFLITSLLLAESGRSGHVRLGRFWGRRARRLLPALGGLLVGIAVYCIVFASPDELGTIRSDALATIGYVANWRLIVAGTDYFALFREPSPLGHVWSLAIEEQFYLVWPLIFVGLLAWRRAKAPRAVFVTAVVLAIVSAGLMVALYDPLRPSRVYFGTDTRAAAVLMGAALAAGFAVWGHVTTRTARLGVEVVGGLGALALAVLWTRLPGESSHLYRGGFLVAGLAGIAVIAAAVHPEPMVLGRALSFRPLCLLGLVSYGLYLWHWPVDVVFQGHSGLTGWTLFLAETAVALAITIVSYRFLEMPIRRGAISGRQWLVLAPVSVVGIVALLLVATAGAEPAPQAGFQRAGTPGGVLVVGDSVAGSTVPGLVRAGLDVSARTRAGCRLIAGTLPFPTSAPCTWQKDFNAAVLRARPETVLLMMGVFEMFDVRPNGTSRYLRPGTRAWAATYERALERAITVLGRHGARIVIPTIPCMGSIPATKERMDQGPAQVARVRAANAVIRTVARRHPDRVVVPDLFALLCPDGRYQSGLRGVDPVRVDGEHYTRAGADLVARWLLPTLQPPATSGAPAGAVTPGG